MINTGVAFGWLPNVSFWLILLVWMALIVYAAKVRELWERVGLWLIVLGGGLNLLSRLIHGGVRDNWSFLGLLYNNGADYLIFFGVVIYGYTYFVRR